MYLLVGLGNPGKKYEYNRHNIGYLSIDKLLSCFGEYTERKKFNSILYEIKLNSQKILLAKPLTYMNNSGEPINQLINYYKIPSSNVFVFHDELDIPFGNIKLKKGGGNAGHNGLKSLVSHLNNDFIRIRIGISHPGSKELVSNYVLNNFSSNEKKSLDTILSYISSNIDKIINEKEKFKIEFILNSDKVEDKISTFEKIINIFK
jgi:PTH1 family peptidyl-tRNA hydrolase